MGGVGTHNCDRRRTPTLWIRLDAVRLAPNGSVLVSGQFFNKVLFDQPVVAEVTSFGGTDGIVIRFYPTSRITPRAPRGTRGANLDVNRQLVSIDI